MQGEIVYSQEPIALIGGGSTDSALLGEVLQLTSGIVAADGGAATALAAGLEPLAVIGDFDSIPAEILRRIPLSRQHHLEEQESTDFDKCLRNISAPLILGAGFCGGRVDHELAAYHTLVRHPSKRCILLGVEDIIFLAPPDLRLEPPLGSRLSLFPMARVSGESEGLAWPIGGLDFSPAEKIGTSNQVDGPVRLRFSAPAMLVIMPRAALADVAAAICAQSAGWPAP